MSELIVNTISGLGDLSVGNSTINTAITTTGITHNGLNIRNLKNYIVNPGMRISQENGTASGTASGYYFADQWRSNLSTSAGTLTFAQVASATPGGSTHRGRLTITAADASLAAGEYCEFLQILEGLQISDLLWGTASAKDVVVRFGFKGPAGTYAAAIGNQAGDRGYVREFTISGGEANTDTVQTVTFPGETTGTWDTGNTGSLQFRVVVAVGSTYQTTADAWQAGIYLGTSSTSNGIGTISEVFELFDVGLYADPDSTGVAPPFVLSNYDQDFASCQRYYVSLSGAFLASNLDYATSNFPVTMRTAPSYTLFNLTGTGATFARYDTSYYQSTSHSTTTSYGVFFNARM